jgi:hypothetical protein
MRTPRRRSLPKQAVVSATALILGLAILGRGLAFAQEGLPPRLQIGINLLPAIIAANTGLANIDPAQSIQVYIVYLENNRDAELLQRGVAGIGRIKQRPLESRVVSLDELLALKVESMSTLIVAEPMASRLPELVEYSHSRRVLLFSPFKGDVAEGVATGFFVSDRVRPLVNMESLNRSKIQLKAFFLRIAVQHE